MELVVNGVTVDADSFLAEMPTEADKYTATGGELTKGYGEPMTADDVIAKVKTDYPKDAAKQPTISVDNPDKLPDGKAAGHAWILVTVTYPDGSQDKLNVDLTVLDKVIDQTKTPNNPTPAGYVRVTFNAGGHGSFAAGAGTIFDVKIGTAIADVPVPAAVADKGYTVQYQAVPAEGQQVTTQPGGQPGPADGIKNKDKLPDRTKYEWKNPVDTSTPGDKTGVIVVTYPDGTQTEVTVTVHVVGEAVTTPAASQPAPVQTAVKTGATEKKLPQTGEDHNGALALAGVCLMSFATLFGFGELRRKR